jgi:predicted ATP-binding protein involved in virulence
MNRIFLSSINNSRAAYEPFISATGHRTSVSVFSHNQGEMQSPSVTSSGFLWLQALARMAYENPHTVAQSEIKKNEQYPSVAQTQKSRELVQLLRAWREGDEDEQEQRNTWEYLRQALDEDRLSERKLFP